MGALTGAQVTAAQLAGLAPRGHVREHGPSANAGVFGKLAGAGGLTKSMLGLIDIPPFTARAMTHHELDVAGLMTARSLITKKADQRRRLLILETMAPRLPVDKLMTQREARDALEVILGPQGDLRMSAWFQSYAAIVIPGADVWGAATGEWAATVILVQKVGHV
ncbi:hypothetical protein CesoFtcFv8_024751 [Champsocephalus esox]|uniref:Uncharacterized protein n=1 Tax=Champsocephalus esox TaxID=159716 RepID=A0AAN8GHE7_9TELE|nr:hypothetical protein CesoFtcFv8_024751 [Champsocephalus esox]